MTWRVPPYDRAVVEAEAFIRASWKVHGIIVAGSIVRGEAQPNSDLDIVIVHAEPWRVRDQRRFAGVPAELFVNPPERIRGYFEDDHADGRPYTASMLTTGEVLADADDIVDELVREAREWMAKPLQVTAAQLAARRYAAVDALDDARDTIATDATAASLLLRTAVQRIAEYAFWQRSMFQPRRKELVRALAAIDPIAANHLRAFTGAGGEDALEVALALAHHVLGTDTFFSWTSERS